MSLAWLYEHEHIYQQRTGKAVWSLSDWHNDPGDVVLPASMLSTLSVDPDTLSRYRFMDTVISTKSKIGEFYSGTYGLLLESDRFAISHNGTAALHLTIRSLALAGVDRILMVTPAYFSLFDVLKLYGITVVYAHTNLADDTATAVGRLLKIAREQMVAAIFITNPIFATGRALGRDYLERMKEYADRTGTWLVIDESLGGLPWAPTAERPFATSVMGLAVNHPRIVYLWSVSKALFLNGLKHSLVAAPDNIIRSMEKAADLVIGSFSTHQLLLVERIYSAAHSAEISECARLNILQFSAAYDLCVASVSGTSFQLTPVDTGFHTVAYTTKAFERPAEVARRVAIEMIERFGVSAIPLAHFGFPPFSPVGFRVNLSKNPGKLCDALVRLPEIVHKYSHFAH